MAEIARQNITETIAEYGKRLFGFIRSKVKTDEDAEDLLQDVWYQFSKLSSLDEIESVSGWLFRVTRNKVTDFYRKKKSISVEDFSYETEEGETNFLELLMADDPDPSIRMFKELFWEELMLGLEELPPNQREVFIQNELEDLTLREIASKTGESIKTIISRKGYAVKHLRKRLAELYHEMNNN